MDRAYEVKIDSQGHLDLPESVRNHHGFRSGVKVRIEDRESEVVIKPLAQTVSPSVARMKAAIASSVGMLGTDPVTFEAYLEEKRRDRESEDRYLRSR